MNNLSCMCVPGVDGLSSADLRRLFPEPSRTAHFLSLLQESGVDGFTLHTIVVLQDDVPVLLVPLFEARFDLATFVEGWHKAVLNVAGCLIPTVFRPRVLGVGSLVAEWSEIGIDPAIDAGTLDAACILAFDAVQTLAVELESDMVALYNFKQHSNLPGEVVNNFNRVQYRSSARLPIDFSSMEEYLSRLSKAARKDLRRKMRVAPEVRVLRSTAIFPFLDRIYALYLETVARGPLALGRYNRTFFELICEMVPGAGFTLYFVQEKLVAFNLLVVTEEAMADKLFCMEYGLGRTYNLYVLSWVENVRTCVERNIPFYYTGQGTEKTKAHLGATFVPSFIFFKHRYQVVDRLLVWQSAVINKVLSYLRFWPRMEIHDH
jgi:hypothetical protein